MSHDSWVILPLLFLAEDGHTIALINPWKFHWDWSSHLWVYKGLPTGFLMFLAPTNCAPVGAWLCMGHKLVSGEWKLSKQERLCLLRARAEETKKKDPRFMRLLTINSATEDGDILCCYSTLKILMLLQERQKLVEELQTKLKTQFSVSWSMKNSIVLLLHSVEKFSIQKSLFH